MADCAVQQSCWLRLQAKAAVPRLGRPDDRSKTMTINPQNFLAAGKANLEAVSESAKIWAAGTQDLTKQVAASVQASYADSMAAFKALTAARSLTDVVTLQGDYSKAAIAKAVADTTKVTEASLKLAEQAMAPLTARVAVAVDSFSKAA
jgi:phasin family protein